MRRLFCICLVAALGCTGKAPNDQGDDDDVEDPEEEIPFEPDRPAVYVAKVKNLLVGLPPTDAEVAAVVADPNALAGLIDGWMQLPAYERKMLRFFQLAFQQTQITKASFIDISPAGLGLPRNGLPELLLRNIEESFARTVIALNKQGRPFNEAITTKQFMMTTPLMEWYGYLDAVYLDNDARLIDRFPSMVGNRNVYIGTAPVSLTASLDPSNANFLRFTDSRVASMPLTAPSCDPLTWDPSPVGSRGSFGLHNWFYGLLTNSNWTSPTGVQCRSVSGVPNVQWFTAADFDNWRMVTLRKPNAGEATAPFWNIPRLRTATELVLRTPRQGFFSTPAFHANWPTNTSNQMRVTANQTLIVALGEGIDGQDPTIPGSTPGLDETHAAPGSACFGCHQLLDPMRSVLAANYSWGYGPQTDQAFVNQPGQFAFEGVIKPMANIDDFASALATHPQFPRAWAQKLCYYANSAPCEIDDPELIRVVDAFVASNLSWNTLVRELFASPLITHASKTASAAKQGVVVAVSRLDHLCASLNERLGLADACVREPQNKVPAPRTSTIELVVGGLPSDGYGRGSVVPVLPNEPTMFFRAAVENICIGIANQVVDSPTPKWRSTEPDAAIADFVTVMMGFTSSDTRAAPATTLLRSHFDAAIAAGHTATNALKSTFVVSCLAPSFLSIGM
jgi:hypothetical protein